MLSIRTLLKVANKICEELGLDVFSPNMSFYFALFAYPCDMRKILDKFKDSHKQIDSDLSDELTEQIRLANQAISIINLIENAMNRFSKKIFKRLMDIPEIAHMMKYFLQEGRNQLQTGNDYAECISMLDRTSKEDKFSQELIQERADYYITAPFFETLGLIKS